METMHIFNRQNLICSSLEMMIFPLPVQLHSTHTPPQTITVFALYTPSHLEKKFHFLILYVDLKTKKHLLWAYTPSMSCTKSFKCLSAFASL